MHGADIVGRALTGPLLVDHRRGPGTGYQVFLRVGAGLVLESPTRPGDDDLGMRILRVLSIAAPLCLAGYGIVRIVGRAGGQYGPGGSWSAAHSAAGSDSAWSGTSASRRVA